MQRVRSSEIAKRVDESKREKKKERKERHNNNILVAKLRAFSSSLSDQRFQARSHNNPPAALDGASENCRAGKRGPCIACNLIDEKF